VVTEHGHLSRKKSPKIREQQEFKRWKETELAMAETTEISEIGLEQESQATADSSTRRPSSPSALRALKFADTMRTETQGVKAAEAVTAIANSPTRIYLTVGLYGLLFFGALWASLNLLHWFWHRLL
jgi:hypothetical protein